MYDYFYDIVLLFSIIVSMRCSHWTRIQDKMHTGLLHIGSVLVRKKLKNPYNLAEGVYHPPGCWAGGSEDESPRYSSEQLRAYF